MSYQHPKKVEMKQPKVGKRTQHHTLASRSVLHITVFIEQIFLVFNERTDIIFTVIHSPLFVHTLFPYRSCLFLASILTFVSIFDHLQQLIIYANFIASQVHSSAFTCHEFPNYAFDHTASIHLPQNLDRKIFRHDQFFSS